VNYKAKFSTISILKNKIDKNKFEENDNNKKKKKKKKKTLWISIVIHSAISIG
jgi:membrane-anchored glycerophosphoryl diester phosphodiesterase (GDPDase)